MRKLLQNLAFNYVKRGLGAAFILGLCACSETDDKLQSLTIDVAQTQSRDMAPVAPVAEASYRIWVDVPMVVWEEYGNLSQEEIQALPELHIEGFDAKGELEAGGLTLSLSSQAILSQKDSSFSLTTQSEWIKIEKFMTYSSANNSFFISKDDIIQASKSKLNGETKLSFAMDFVEAKTFEAYAFTVPFLISEIEN